MESKVIKVQVTFDQKELGHLRYMLHDSTAHWRSHLWKAREDKEYYLTESGCAAVLEECETMYKQIVKLYNETFD